MDYKVLVNYEFDSLKDAVDYLRHIKGLSKMFFDNNDSKRPKYNILVEEDNIDEIF